MPPPRNRRSPNPRQPPSDLNGVLPVVKPAGPTSHDVVEVARRVLGQRQIGHTGTLDPAASGVLVLCLGPYTKLVPFLVECDKTYEGWIGLGLETTTDDSEGSPTLVANADEATPERIRRLAAQFVGDIDQMPPKYAAVKVAGKKLYEYAREGVEIEVPPRPVTVHNFDIGDLEPLASPEAILARAVGGPHEVSAARHAQHLKRVAFNTKVSAGTYVRSLARDLGRALGCGGYLAGLSRTAVGQFDLGMCMPYETLTGEPQRVREWLLRGASSLDADRFPVLRLIRGYTDRLLRGQPLHEKMMENAEEAAKVPSGTAVGIASDDGLTLYAMMQAESFEQGAQENVYGTRHANHFTPLRVFPGGLK